MKKCDFGFTDVSMVTFKVRFSRFSRFCPLVCLDDIDLKDNVRVCACCFWTWEAYDIGVSCPRCNFGSYSFNSIAVTDEERKTYMSLDLWKERAKLPEKIADLIIKAHRESKSIENL